MKNFSHDEWIVRVSELKQCWQIIFELTPPTILDSGHATKSLSADQTIYFAPAIGIEVALASYGLLENLMLVNHEELLLLVSVDKPVDLHSPVQLP